MRHHHPQLLAGLLLSAACCLPSVALADRASEAAERFKAADKNADGKLTLDEAKAGMPRVAKNFDKIDKDKKGFVTLDDIKATMASN